MPYLEQDGIKRWSTADVSTATRLDYFAAALSEATFPLGVDNADPQTQESNGHRVIFGICIPPRVRNIGFYPVGDGFQQPISRQAGHSSPSERS